MKSGDCVGLSSSSTAPVARVPWHRGMSSERIATPPSTIKLLVRTMVKDPSAITKSKLNRHNNCFTPLLRDVLTADVLRTDLFDRGGLFSSQTMHSSRSGSSAGNDTHPSRSFTALDHCTPRLQHHVSLSQPCLPVSNLGPTKILPYLFLGSLSDAHCEETMTQNGITYILNVSVSSPRPSFIQDGHFLRIPVNDGYSDKLSPFFSEAFQFLDKVREANGCVLIHCLAGISRSPSVAIAYIMQLLKVTMDEAYRYVKDKRPTISPNFNFLGQLLEYEKQLTVKEFNTRDGYLETPLLNTQSTDYQTIMLPRPKSCQQGMTVNLVPPQTGHAVTLTSPTSALARLNFSHLSPLTEQSSPPADRSETSRNSQVSQITPVVTCGFGTKHCAIKRPLSDRTTDGHDHQENGHDEVGKKRTLKRPSSINFSSAAVTGAKQRVATPSSFYVPTKDAVSDNWKILLTPTPTSEQEYSSCPKKCSSPGYDTSMTDGSKCEESRLQVKNKPCLLADDEWISENNDAHQHKSKTEEPHKGIQLGDALTSRPNKLPLVGWNVTMAGSRPTHSNTVFPLKSDVITYCTMSVPETTCGTKSDLNKIADTETAMPACSSLTLGCMFDCNNDLPHSMTARKSRSLEDILSHPSPFEMKYPNDQDIFASCNKHLYCRINMLTSPVTLTLDKHGLCCQTTKSDSFKIPSSNESPEMIPVS